MVQIHLPPCLRLCGSCGSSSSGRASAFQAEGSGFKSRLPLVAQVVERESGKGPGERSELESGKRLGERSELESGKEEA